ncbi:MAG: COP23 domain-containing protein [Goleter apudmare HA4340-LM2]|jgi:hypothetical protein|nr:COP23 domain-containing protein [Goleter apudmare HA4340-LM2]
MRQKLLAEVLTITKICMAFLLAASATTLSTSQPSYARGLTFFCRQHKGVPVTFARTQDGKSIPVVNWVSNSYFPPPWTAQKRCLEVSRRFQKNYDNGNLRNISIGKIRGEPVICAANKPNTPCTDSTLLFTLKRGANPSETVRRLFDRRALAAGNTLDESGTEEITIDFDAYLKNATGEVNSQPSISEAADP